MSETGLAAVRSRTSPNRSGRGGSPVALVVLHYTGMESVRAALDRLTDPEAEVSAHYLIDPAGRVCRLVPERERAWHAGRSSWAGVRGINAASIGIELAHAGHAGRSRRYPDAQVAALEELLGDICRRRRLGPGAVVGHSDVAPTRKRDPGEWFPWRRLAERGLAAWSPESGAESGADDAAARMLQALSTVGYDVGEGGIGTPAARAALGAFRRRFRPWELGRAPTGAALLHAERVAGEWPGAAVFRGRHADPDRPAPTWRDDEAAGTALRLSRPGGKG